ncbi:uncharacterized protein A1O9_03017 [Exophiala aquamarina CBS 119918]|uniref:Transcription factor domain-containing protein n=1 Tax=Exophiala aquamarina CBS 119918 TaxID=1182545 RepID=A0A072PNI5_9EURO|nr:uncharacterized protein A1O9_03017 [Exophiala aquamarina CBS 119918]KEF61451.1 hypothetical protein A1O9_03017 [Exophiala aquamarina CBS 119918]
MHEHFTRSGRMSPNTYGNKLDFALTHYGRAIREVVHINETRGEHAFDCALITCGLFSIFESLQGHYHSAFSHAVSGIKIMAEWQQDRLSKLRTSDRNMYIAHSELMRFFFAFWRQILEIGDWNFQGERPLLDPPAWRTPEIFRSNDEALTYVEYNMSAFFAFYEKTERLTRTGAMTPEIGVDMQAKFQTLTKSLSDCEQACQAMVASRADPSLGKTPSGLILGIHRILLTIFVALMQTTMEPDAFDHHLPLIQEALDFVEEFLVVTNSLIPGDSPPRSRKNSPSRSVSPETRALSLDRTMAPRFSMSPGVVPILFVIATRCNELSARDRALHLLRICNRKEGFWDSQLSACLATRTIEIKANAVEKFRSATPNGFGNREVRDSDITMKLEAIQYYPDNECVLHYSLMWPLGDDASDDGMGLALGTPGEALIRKRDFSERLAWGDQLDVVGTEDAFTSMMPNGLISEEIRKPLHVWEKHGMVR